METARDALAERLRRLQEASGHGVRALAREAGISPSSLSRYLIGQTVPPWRSVVDLCRVTQRDPRPLRALWEQASASPAPPRTPAPHNDLPRDVPDFTGRTAEMASVVNAVRASRIVTIDGMAGVGKTCLAVHAAHQLAADHPDAQLYIDLHGFTPDREPTSSDDALRLLLSAFGVTSLPEGVEQLSARWRAELARRNAVVVLDNAAHADQVRPLLPGAGSSVALVTSRVRLVDLDVPPVSLDVLSTADSALLLTRAGGDDRPDREPDATARVLRLCGNLPLAIRLAAARLRHRPGWSVAVLAERLAAGGTDHVDTALGMSLRQLGRDARRLFGLLGLLPGSFDAYAVAAVASVSHSEAVEILEELVDAHLVQQPSFDRYRLHDLVRDYAVRQAAPSDADLATERMFAHYLSATSSAPALDWLDREYATLLAVFDRAVAVKADDFLRRFPQSLKAYFFRRGVTADANRMLEHALAAAERNGDPHDLAHAHADLAAARHDACRLTDAAEHYESAERLLEGITDPAFAGHLAARHGYVDQCRGDIRQALRRYQQSAEHFTTASDTHRLADALAFQAWANYQLGEYAEAASIALAALDLRPEDGDRGRRTTELVTLGASLARHDPAAGLVHIQHAVDLARADRNRPSEAWCLNYLGVVLRHAGQYDAALAQHEAALSIVEDLAEEQWAVQYLNSYAATHQAAGNASEALRLYRSALDLAKSTGFGHEAATARQGIEALST